MKRGNFATADLYLAAFLIVKGARLERIDRSNPRRVRFVFSSVDPALVAAYWRGEARVGALQFAEAIRRAKTLIFRRDLMMEKDSATPASLEEP